MALSFDLKTSDSISLEDFISRVNQKLNSEQEESLLDCVEDIQKLSNNSEFLLDKLHEELIDLEKFNTKNNYSSQSNILYRNEKFFIRINTWEPLSENLKERERQNKLYLYGKAHDHNFSLLTVGYFGSGYETELWEYDYNKVIGYKGEKIDMNYLERARLSKNKSMIYRMSKDIHTQFEPKDFTISLNLIPISQQTSKNEQFIFDTEKKIILNNTSNEGTSRYFILKLASEYGDNSTLKIVEEIASKHEFPFMRIKSYETIANLTGNHIDIWNLALRKDKNDLVKNFALRQLSSLK